jgi:MFS family permease
MDEKAAHASAKPEHIEELERTHTNIDVIETTQQNPYGEINFIGTYIAVTLACCASFAGFIMPVTSLQVIEAELGVSPNAVWIALAWILLSAVSFILLGRLSDIFGRRWFFTGCTVSALIGSIIGATANKTEVLIAASVFLGLGSAGQLSFNYSLGELVPMRHRFAVNGFIFLATLPFSGLGPYLARLMIFNTSSGFRSIYYLAIGLNGASTICWLIFYHPPSFNKLHRNRTISDELKELDIGGIFLYISGFFLFLLGLAWGGSVHPWSSAYVLAPLLIGLATMGVFVAYGTSNHLHEGCIADADASLPIRVVHEPSSPADSDASFPQPGLCDREHSVGCRRCCLLYGEYSESPVMSNYL